MQVAARAEWCITLALTPDPSSPFLSSMQCDPLLMQNAMNCYIPRTKLKLNGNMHLRVWSIHTQSIHQGTPTRLGAIYIHKYHQRPGVCLSSCGRP